MAGQLLAFFAIAFVIMIFSGLAGISIWWAILIIALLLLAFAAYYFIDRRDDKRNVSGRDLEDQLTFDSTANKRGERPIDKITHRPVH